jgi:RNA polymerase sigma-70 factor (ECF subfamily)
MIQPERAMMHSENLVTEACNGNAQAQDRLVQLWYRRIYNFCYKFFMDHDLAMEATQKTFISMYRNLPALSDAARFRSWLYTIAVNQCRQEARNRRNNIPLPTHAGLTEEHTSTDWEKSNHRHENPERHLVHKELADILQECLLQLSPEQREIVIMKEYEGLKFREIAEVLGIPENTAKSRLYYGLTNLKRLLERRNITPEIFNDEN